MIEGYQIPYVLTKLFSPKREEWLLEGELL